jgi:hypothetical protein
VKHVKGDVVKILRELEDLVHKFVWTMEDHLGGQLRGWKEVLELVRFARGAWQEVAE